MVRKMTLLVCAATLKSMNGSVLPIPTDATVRIKFDAKITSTTPSVGDPFCVKWLPPPYDWIFISIFGE